MIRGMKNVLCMHQALLVIGQQNSRTFPKGPYPMAASPQGYGTSFKDKMSHSGGTG